MSSSEPKQPAVRLGSSEVQLSLRQWAVVAAVVAVMFLLTPRLWQHVEKLQTGPNARVPYSLSNDYWVYGRYSRLARSEDKFLVLGDSVVWGHYVSSDQTLPAHLNAQLGEPRFANLGVDGTHPAAMAGLIEYYGQAVADRKVLLHCNLLWMSSRRHDLQTDKEFSFNHPTLVPQFRPWIRCYAEPIGGRLTTAIGRQVELFAWARHLQMAYFGNSDLPSWTLTHPYANPLGRITLELPSPDEVPSPPPVAKPWTQADLQPLNANWVELDTSFQWASFQRAIETLQRRGNRVFVLVGPFNEHMLTPKSRKLYQERLQTAGSWLKEHEIPHCIAELLPSDDYADASHPLADGYAKLAQYLLKDAAFGGFFTK